MAHLYLPVTAATLARMVDTVILDRAWNRQALIQPALTKSVCVPSFVLPMIPATLGVAKALSVVHTGAFINVPLMPFPEVSPALVPLVSVNGQRPIKPAALVMRKSLLAAIWEAVRFVFQMRTSSRLPLK